MLKHLFAALLCLIPAFSFAQEKSRAILVLDASGSMWGQIDGKAKITIAQEVIGELLQSLPADQELGLTVYGHRRKGDCSDIETMIAPGGDTRAAIGSAVNAITPKGKTPLSAAVIQAAEALKYTEERATVILVSDGRETCELDPCEVGRKLEESGVDFTAHVIGFDISDAKDRAELQCLAEETGGTFRTASNASELNDALQVIAEPDPIKVTFRAIEGKDGPVVETPLVWWLGHDGKIIINNTPHDNNFTMDMLAGSGRVEVMRPEDEAVTEAEFMVSEDNMTVTLVLPALTPPASLNAPDTAIAGSNIAIEWDGPNANSDYITVAEIGSAGNQYIAFEYTRGGSPASLKMPLRAGEYQLRYVLGQGREIIARRKIMITPVTATLSPPAPITAGSMFVLEWTGPDYKNDYISLAKPGSPVNQYDTFEYTRDGSPLSLRAPTTPGTYSLRYIAAGPDQMALATQEVEVEAVSATLESNDTVPAGSKLQVTWTGPNDKNDYIAFNEVGDDLNGEISYAYVKNSTGDSIAVDVPTTPGTYELRYIQNGSPKALLATKSIVVEPVLATLETINPAPAGSNLLVTWTGPNDQNDYIAFNEVGDDLNGEISYAYLKNSTGDSIAIDVPTTPGTYELRYIQNGKPKRMLTANTITVELVSATLETINPVPAGSNLLVTWTGPNDQNDYIAFNEVGDDLNGEISYAYLKKSTGDSIAIDVPTTPGTYELRYIQNGKPKRMLTANTIIVELVSATLESKDIAPAGGELQVTWTGPNSENDYLAINEVGDDLNGELSYAYVKNSTGDSIALKLPTTPGTYELRYVQNGRPKALLASKTIIVEPVTATLNSDDTVSAGSKLKVVWTGPNNKNDYIALAEVGSRIQDEVAYTYISNGDGQAVMIDMPTSPGVYELRYIQNGSPKVQLATKPLTIIEVSASVVSNDIVPAGGQLLVTWTGPNSKNDYIALAEIGSRIQDEVAYTYLSQSNGDIVAIKVPTTTGNYELRYIQNGSPKAMLASKPVTIEAVSANLDANETAPSGGKILVTWSGPNNKNDYVAIAEVGSRVQDEATYTYLARSDGQTLMVDVPSIPGTYEMRYIQNGTPKAVLFSRPLIVEAISATLTAKDVTAPGSNLVVEWTGPNYKNDRIAISRVGDTKYESYAYTNDGTPLIIKVPDAPGDYELMYVMGQDSHVLTRQPLSIK